MSRDTVPNVIQYLVLYSNHGPETKEGTLGLNFVQPVSGDAHMTTRP